VDGDGSPSLGESGCNGGSQAAGGACDKGDFVVETEQVKDGLHGVVTLKAR
jgi:hypothetical protein